MIYLRRISLLLLLADTCLLAEGGYIQAKAILAQHLLKEAWARTLTNRNQNKPWPWADTWPRARLIAPAHNIDQIVLANDSGSSLAFGPGHMTRSSPPNQPGNTIISGHRDTHFRFLKKIKIGDAFLLQGKDGKLEKYRVSNLLVQDMDKIAIPLTSPKPTLTLVTCYPFDAVRQAKLRFIVICQQDLPDG